MAERKKLAAGTLLRSLGREAEAKEADLALRVSLEQFAGKTETREVQLTARCTRTGTATPLTLASRSDPRSS